VKPIRSLLYVPANEPDWVATAPSKYDADAIIYDLEDAVPPGDKEEAREILASTLPDLADGETVITVRVNAPGTDEFDADLEAVAREGTDALVVPKLPQVDDVRRTGHVLDYLEDRRDLTEAIELVLEPETARGFSRAEQLCTASERVEALIGASSPGGDIERALGFDWTREGDERRHLLTKLVMDGRAAGLTQLIAGPWTDIDDLDGLRAEAESMSQHGYTGFQTIHPSHVEVVNDVFTPDPEEAEQAQTLLDAFEDNDSTGVFRFDDEMVDEAHRKRAEQIVERAEAFGLL